MRSYPSNITSHTLEQYADDSSSPLLITYHKIRIDDQELIVVKVVYPDGEVATQFYYTADWQLLRHEGELYG